MNFITLAPDLTKVMVTNGYANASSQLVEIVDLTSPATACPTLRQYPIGVRGTTGGLLDNRAPLICGGGYSNSCYVYQGPKP